MNFKVHRNCIYLPNIAENHTRGFVFIRCLILSLSRVNSVIESMMSMLRRCLCSYIVALYATFVAVFCGFSKFWRGE